MDSSAQTLIMDNIYGPVGYGELRELVSVYLGSYGMAGRSP